MSLDAKMISILIVDDEKQILKSLNRLLKKNGYQTIAAESGSEALDILKLKKDLALIITDQRMPGMSGVEISEKAKKLQPDTARFPAHWFFRP